MILALENPSKGRPATDGALAVLITQPQPESCDSIVDYYLEIGALENLERIAEKVVRDFNRGLLEKSRGLKPKQ